MNQNCDRAGSISGLAGCVSWWVDWVSVVFVRFYRIAY